MHAKFLSTQGFLLRLLAMSLIVGCNSDSVFKTIEEVVATHESEEAPITEADVTMPATYVEAIHRIKSYRDVIRSAVEANTPHDAHRPLDELNIVLNKLPPIARDSGVAKEQWETVNVTARELRHLFDKIHSAIDENRPADYSTLADPIEKAIERIEGVATAGREP